MITKARYRSEAIRTDAHLVVRLQTNINDVVEFVSSRNILISTLSFD